MSDSGLDSAGEQAIDWMVRLRAGQADASLHAHFADWLDSDPAHQHAWARLQERLGGSFNVLRAFDQRLPGQAGEARRVLLEPSSGRRDVLRALAGLGLLGGALWLGTRSEVAAPLWADLHTGRGERRDFVLADGSHLSLDAGSAVDVQFSQSQRLLVLRQGQLIVQVTADAQRPFRVRTAQGEFRALGTRFLLSQQDDASTLVVLEHSVRASLPNGVWRDVQEGQAVRASRQRIELLGGGLNRRADWLNGRLNVLDDPLEDVVNALRPYHKGLIRVSPEVRPLRVQGVFPLDQPDQALNALAETLPIRVDRYGPWLIVVRAKS